MLNDAKNISIAKNANVHNTAILLGESIVIEDNVFIGPYCVLNGNITLKKGVRLTSHVAISGNTTIGEETTVYSFASIGSIPQDLKYKGEKSFLEIGSKNVIRENVTINSGTAHGGLYTKIGNENLLMIGVHIGHDCIIGNNCVIASNVGIAGHVLVEDNVIIGGHAAVHQFVRIGRNAMIGGMSALVIDVPPFCLYVGSRVSKLRGLNLVGLKRHGFSKSDIKNIKDAFDTIFSENYHEGAKKLAQTNKNEKVKIVLDFILSGETRHLCIWDKTFKQTEEDV